MRRNESEVKAELLKRRDRYLIHKQKIKKRIIAAVVCFAIIIGTVAVVLSMPNGSNTPENNTIHNSKIETPFDSYDNESTVSDPDISGSDSSDDAAEPLYSEDSSVDVAISEDDISNWESAVPDYSEPDDTTASDDVHTSEDDPVPPEISEDIPPEDSPPIEDKVEVDMIYPEMPKDGKALNLLKTLSATGVNGSPVNYSFSSAVSSFSASFFKGCAVGEENALVSPFSIMVALAMTANGAAGDTEWAMEKALGGFETEALNKYLYTYVNNLPCYDNLRLSVKNSVWIKEGFGINKNFLQTLLDYYDADAYMAPFTEQTKDEVNTWIKENTDGKINEMLNSIPPTAMMLLINTIDFDAKWQTAFSEGSVYENQPFTNADGSTTLVDYMCDAEEDGKYIETSLATGFIRDYQNGYSFVALLPKNENGLNDLVASMSGSQILSILNGYKKAQISYRIPKFSFTSSTSSDLIEKTLTDIGMGSAFDKENADFRRMHDDGAYIDQILHDTTITVNRKGTKAGAASLVIMAPPTGGGSDDPPPPWNPKTVYLDRPFMYMIVDAVNNVPIFMGTVTNMAKSNNDVETEPVRNDLMSGRDYEFPGGFEYTLSFENSDEGATDESSGDSTAQAPETSTGDPQEDYAIESVTVIRSTEELEDYCNAYLYTDVYDDFSSITYSIGNFFFYDNVLVFISVEDNRSGIDYRLNEAYFYSETDDSAEVVLEYNRTEYPDAVKGDYVYLLALAISDEVYEQVDGITVTIND